MDFELERMELLTRQKLHTIREEAKMKKRLLATLLACAMTATLLAGCGGGTDDTASTTTEETTDAAETEETTDAAAEETTDAAETEDAAETAETADTHVRYDDIKEELGAIPAAAKDMTFNIGFCGKAFENEFWRMEKEGAEAAAAALQELGLDVTVTAQSAAGESDVQGQETVMKAMSNGDYDALMVAPISDTNLTAAIEAAQEAGIPMTYVNDKDANVDLPEVVAYHKETAEMAAEWIATKLGGTGKVAVIQGLPTAEAARLRTDCFVDYMEANYPDIEVVAQQNADWDRTKAKDIATTIIQNNPDIGAFYANNDTMAMGVLEAVKEADLLGKVLVVGTDGTTEALDSIKAGELSATVNDFPYYQAQVAVEMLVRTLAGQDVPEKIYSPHAVIDSENCDLSNEEVLGWTGFTVEE